MLLQPSKRTLAIALSAYIEGLERQQAWVSELQMRFADLSYWKRWGEAIADLPGSRPIFWDFG